MDARAVARRLGIRAATLRAWNDSGVGPLPDEHERYRADAVSAWMEEIASATLMSTQD